MPLIDIYKKTPYEPLVPTKVDSGQMSFKFNSPQHFFSWIQALDEMPRNGQSSQRSSNDRDFSFSLSKSLEDAYRVLRSTQFDPRKTDVLQANIAELKRSTVFSDDGYEIDVPEHLAGSDKVWIKPRQDRKPTRLIEDVLMIDAVYSSYRDAERCKNIGLDILTGIYRRRVIPRKMVIIFASLGVRTDTHQDHFVSVDVNFSDLNGIAKLLHPSAFRRLFFRLVEIYPDLAYGYGRPRDGCTQKGYICINNVYNDWNASSAEISIDTFLGVKPKK